MRLKLRAVQLRVQSETLLCGADINFEDGLVVLRADNSSGKSTVVQSIIYALGLEGMLSASYDVPLPHVMTDSIIIDDTELKVKESYVCVEIENAKGDIVTVLRGIKGPRNRRLVTVTNGPAISASNESFESMDYYVREGGAATNERGFHTWFASFLGWSLPQVGRTDGTDCPLYVECIFPLMIIEQKRGWSAIQARMPFHYRIRDVAKKATEFLLALDVYELARRRQKLREEAALLQNEWNRGVDRVASHASSINAVVQNLQDNDPKMWRSEDEPRILVSSPSGWLPFAEVLRQDVGELADLELREIPRVEAVAQSIETALSDNEAELNSVDFAAGELLREIEYDQQQLKGISERLTALEEDERRNYDLLKLQRLGSVQAIATARGACPTCNQSVTDALLPQSEELRLMTVEENLKFIRSQIETFKTIREAALKSLTAKRRRMETLRTRTAALRATIRAYRHTLVSESDQLSVEAIERRLRLREKVSTSRRVDEQIASQYSILRDVGRRWKANKAALDALPKGDLSETDQQTLRRLREIFVSAVEQFGLSSVTPSSLQISDENYKPEHNGFDLEFDLSASDTIRTIWAYLQSLLEISREIQTNHLGLLILDEPRQQETARVSFRELFHRAASASNANQQVIIATSEDELTLTSLLRDLKHQYIPFDGRIIAPILEPDPEVEYERLTEMPWQVEAREAVERAVSSMVFNEETGEIEFTNYRNEIVAAGSKSEFEDELRAIAQEAWMSQVPREDGEPEYECDDSSIVGDAIAEYHDQIDEFFGGEDYLLE